MTEIDVASQRSIESTIMSNFPLHGFLGEESVEAGHCASVGMINSSFRYWSTAFLRSHNRKCEYCIACQSYHSC